MERFPENSVIEIQLWEAHLLDRSGQNGKLFVKHSIDGPVFQEGFPLGRIAYRFTRESWVTEIKLFLIRSRIPVSVRYVAINPMEPEAKFIVIS